MKITPSVVLLFALSIVAITLSIVTCSQKAKITEYVTKQKIDSSTIKKWRDSLDNEHAETAVLSISSTQIINDKDVEIDKLKKQLDGKPQNLISKTNTGITTKDTIRTTIHDTTITSNNTNAGDYAGLYKSFEYKDKWIDLAGMIWEDSSLTLNYEVKNEISVINKYKPQGFLKRKKQFVELINGNPHTTTNWIKSFELLPPKKKFFETKAFAIVTGMVAGAIIIKKLN
jgi:hypothetical protein